MKKNVFFIAEISANHCGNLNHAIKLIKKAKIYGADAVKIQTYTADSMTLNSKKNILKLIMVFGKESTCGIYTLKEQRL